MPMPVNIQEKTEREEQAWRLRIRGASEQRIASELGITQQAVSKMLKRISDRKGAQLLEDVAGYKAAVAARLEFAAEEAFDAWDRSKHDAEMEREISGGKGDPKVISETRGQTGHPAHLANALKATQGIRDLLGLDAPKRQEVTGRAGGPILVTEVEYTMPAEEKE